MEPLLIGLLELIAEIRMCDLDEVLCTLAVGLAFEFCNAVLSHDIVDIIAAGRDGSAVIQIRDDLGDFALDGGRHRDDGAAALGRGSAADEVDKAFRELKVWAEENTGTGAQGAPLVLLGLYNARFREGQQRLIGYLKDLAAAGKIRLVVILLGAPYDLPLVKEAACILTTYEYTRLSVHCLLQAIEQNEFPGKSPFTLQV